MLFCAHVYHIFVLLSLRTAYLSHICHQTECDVRKGLVQVAANHVNPREGVSGVRTSLVQCHHMS